MSATSYDCTWSPDNTMVAYTAGAGSAGDLVMVRADGTSLFEIPLATGTEIQTNPDWAPDGRPECPNSTATATSGQAKTIPVQCNDTGPQYERSDVKEFISDQPQNGTAKQDVRRRPDHLHAERELRRHGLHRESRASTTSASAPTRA